MLFNNAVIPAVRSVLSEAIHTALSSRYFHRNEGTTDHATIPEVTLSGDFVIEFNILFSGVGKRFIGCSASTDGRLTVGSTDTDETALTMGFFGTQTSSFNTQSGFIVPNILTRVRASRVGAVATLENMDSGATESLNSFGTSTVVVNSIFRHLASYLSGILANLKIWDNGTLIRDYPIDDNSDDLRELVAGQNGTVINGNASDWGLFQQQATGEWLGQELSSVSVTPVLGSGGGTEFINIAALIQSRSYLCGANFLTYVGVDDAGFTGGVPSSPPYRLTAPSIGDFIGGEFVSSATTDLRMFGRVTSISSFNNVSVKEVLNVA